MYRWRTLSDEDRQVLLEERQKNGLPWHRPPHRESDRTSDYLITAACYQHLPHIAQNEIRIRAFSEMLVRSLGEFSDRIYAWVVLPNHYHALVRSLDIKDLLAGLGQMHGRLSHVWNGEEQERGRTVWHGAAERAMRSDRHFFATLNYIHHNPVKHGLVDKWQDWEFSSVHEYLEEVGRDAALATWRDYPLGSYGNRWDVY